VRKLVAPKSSNEVFLYSLDLDGDGKNDNALFAALGSIITIIPPPGPSEIQKYLDGLINNGKLVLLFELRGTSLSLDPAARIQEFVGKDLDNNPANNFSGTATLGVQPNSPKDLLMSARVGAGKVEAGPGKLAVPLPFSTNSMLLLNLKMARLTAQASTKGLDHGVLGGAILMSDIFGTIFTDLAKELSRIMQDPKTDPSTRKILEQLFDNNKDGKISVDELKNNPLLKVFLKPDIDTDGDKQPDALSVGLGFHAVPCKIKH